MECLSPGDTRYYPDGFADDGTMTYREVNVKCGEWSGGEVRLCADHHTQAVVRYPQGWRAYPGDTCPHGMYTGGCGIDWICGPCEMGE